MPKKIDLDRMELKCECGEILKKTTVDYEGFQMRGWKCKKCGNELADPRDAQRILEIKKAVSKGATVGKVGKSLAIRIPKSLVTFYNIKPGNKIKLAPKAKEISILVGD